MQKQILLIAAAALGLSACAPQPPANEMERRARLAAAAELAAQRCAGQLGGYQSARAAREDANRNMALARQLGATDEDITRQKNAVRAGFDTAVVWQNPQIACNQLVGTLAWSTD